MWVTPGPLSPLLHASFSLPLRHTATPRTAFCGNTCPGFGADVVPRPRAWWGDGLLLAGFGAPRTLVQGTASAVTSRGPSGLALRARLSSKLPQWLPLAPGVAPSCGEGAGRTLTFPCGPSSRGTTTQSRPAWGSRRRGQ